MAAKEVFENLFINDMEIKARELIGMRYRMKPTEELGKWEAVERMRAWHRNYGNWQERKRYYIEVQNKNNHIFDVASFSSHLSNGSNRVPYLIFVPLCYKEAITRVYSSDPRIVVEDFESRKQIGSNRRLRSLLTIRDHKAVVKMLEEQTQYTYRDICDWSYRGEYLRDGVVMYCKSGLKYLKRRPSETRLVCRLFILTYSWNLLFKRVTGK